jgi:hypothetical protein
MARRVFYSFHYDPDCSRVSQVRNIGMVEGNRPATDNEWEQVKKGGDATIERWIKAQLSGRSCCVVLIGQNTAGRKWVTYEISEAWNEEKGVVGVHIHNLKNLQGFQSSKGANPLNAVKFTGNGQMLSSVAKTYDPPYSDSKSVYAHIAANLAAWIDEAVEIRNRN